MRIKQSFLLNGPQISDALSGALSGLDLSGTGIDGGSPGDTSYFNIYVSLEASETEQQLYDYLEGLSVYIDSNSSYAGDTSANEDLADILELGDLGYGLSIKNPETGLYDIVFNSTNYNAISNAFKLKKEMMLDYDISNPDEIVIRSSKGLYDGSNYYNTVEVLYGNGYELSFDGSYFVDTNIVGLRLKNLTKDESVVIEEIISSSNILVSENIDSTWDGDIVTIERLLEPMDGVIATNSDFSKVVGNYAKLEMKFSLPSSYRRNGIKQFALKFISGYE